MRQEGRADVAWRHNCLALAADVGHLDRASIFQVAQGSKDGIVFPRGSHHVVTLSQQSVQRQIKSLGGVGGEHDLTWSGHPE